MGHESENIATTKVVIGGTLPALLRDIVSRVVESGTHISVIRPDSEESGGLTEYVRLHDVDVVIVGCEPAVMDSVGQELLRTKRSLTVVTLSTNGGNGTLFTLTPTSQSLGELSPQTLLGIIHGHHSASAECFTHH